MQGEPTYYESSPGVKRYFCATCGSPLAFVSDKWPGEIHLHAGSLDDPVAIAPTGHMQVAEQVPWAEVHDQLPRYTRYSRDAMNQIVLPEKASMRRGLQPLVALTANGAARVEVGLRQPVTLAARLEMPPQAIALSE